MSTQEHNESTSEQNEVRDRVIKGHTYDGIKEYDNPMPSWWVWLFWICVAFAPLYVIGMELGYIDTYEEDLAEGLADLQAVRSTYADANPSFEADEATLAEIAENQDMIDAGTAHYAAVCAACHGDQGQGLIGPNLADAYWIHGGSLVDIFNVISDGVVAKGMPAWAAQFSPEERAELVAFVHSLQGTNPPGAKEPQGELVE